MPTNRRKRSLLCRSRSAVTESEPQQRLSHDFARGKRRGHPRESLEELDGASADRAIQMLHGDHYWHDRIRRVLADAGFITRRIEQEPTHPVWTMHLTRTSCDLAADNPTAAKQIRKILCKGGVKIRREELSIVSRNKDWIQCAFVLELGLPGVLS
jgi:hypothetical protein